MRKTLIIALFLLLVAFAWADVYPIGTLGTSTSTIYGPFTGLWDYSWTKTIVTAAEMTAAGYNGTDNITGVGYHIGNSPSNYTMVGLHMFIRHTTLSSYTDLSDETGIAMPDSTAFTQVFSGDLTFNGGGWYYISFNLGSFDWDGTSNIEIFWKNWDGAYVSGYPNWTYASTGSDYKVVSKYQDDSFPTVNGSRYTNRTNMAIVTPATTPPNPAALVYPTNADWTFLNGVLNWNASSGGIPDGYDVYLDTVNGSTLVSDNQTGTSYTPTLAPGTTYYWKVIPYNANGPAANCPIWSFKTPTATQLAESFDATTFPPTGWANPNSWSRSTTTPYYGAATAYKSASTTPAILSTPLLAIDGSSTLDFWYRSAVTTGIGQIKVLYSTDRQNWTQVGTTIAMPTNTTWNNTSVALGTIPAGNYYLAFEASSSTTSSTSVYIDHVFGPEAATVVPDPVTLTAPANAATNVALKPTFTWTAAAIGGIPTGYKVYCDTNANPVTQIADVSTTTFTPTTALAYSTTYYWKVVAYNATGNSADSEIRSFTTMADPTIYTFPWLEDFGTTGTTFPPMNWTRWSGLLTQDPVTLASASGYWVQDDFANIVTSPTNKCAKINIYGATSIKHWLMTPPIQMPGTGYQLEFDIALTDFGNTNPITSDPSGTTGVDDKFVVLISDGNSWSTANAVKIWDNDANTTGGIYEVYNDIPHTGAHYILPLDNYTGIKYVAFYGESTVSNADNDFFVDNVHIRQTPLSAVFTIAPELTSWDFGMVPVGGSAEKEFAVTNTGPGNLIVSSITQTNPSFSIVPTPALPWSLTSADPANTFKVVFSPQTAGGPFSTNVTVTYNNGTQATYTISFTGSAYMPATLPITEGWENGQGNWIIVNGTQTNAWHIGAGDATYGPYEGNNFAYISNDGGTTVSYTTNAASVTHIYKDIAFDEDCMEFPLTFQWRCRGEGTTTAWDRLRVYLVDTNVTPVAGTELTTGQVGLANYNQQTAWTAETITLPGSLSGTVKRLVFSWRNDTSVGYQPPANIDNISLTAVPIPTGPVVAPNLDYPADRQTGLSKNGFSFQFSWNMAGSQPDTYNLYLANLADLDPGYSTDDFFAAATAYEDISSPYNPLFTYVYGETYVWTVVGSNAAYPDPVFQWPPYEFTIEPDPTITNFPWDEDFEDGVFPPVGWTVADVDGGGTYWAANTAYNHTTGGTTSARHGYSSSVPAPGQNGWLITPPAAIPNSTNNVILSWWNYNVYPDDMVYNGVKVNTTNDPADPNWVELWSQDSAAAAWGNEVLNINAYKGQTVYFAFNYQGYNADSWHVDDVSIYEVAAALDAPVVTIALTAGQPTLSWEAVTGANSYLVYGATYPYAADPWTLLDTVYTPGYTYTGTAPMEFFKVVASDATAPGPVNGQATPAKNTPILNAPKGFFENGLRK